MISYDDLKKLQLIGFFDTEGLEENGFQITSPDAVNTDFINFEKAVSFYENEYIERIVFTKETKTFEAYLFTTEHELAFRSGQVQTVQDCLKFFAVKFAEFEFIRLDEQYDAVKKFFDDYTESKNNLVQLAGYNYFFQDKNGVVYKTIDPPGKYTYFEKAAVARTARKISDDEESKGSYVLAQKEAIEAGFELPEKPKKAKAKKDQDFSGEF